MDNNGVIDQAEMKKIYQAIYDIIGTGVTRPIYTADERAMIIFSRVDQNGDGLVTKDEFIRGCLQDDELYKILACDGDQNRPKKGAQNRPKKIPRSIDNAEKKSLGQNRAKMFNIRRDFKNRNLN